MPERDKPGTIIGMPTTKMMMLLRRAECHVGGEAWTNCIAPCKRPRSVGVGLSMISESWDSWEVNKGLLGRIGGEGRDLRDAKRGLIDRLREK